MTRNQIIAGGVIAVLLVLGVRSCSSDKQQTVQVQQPTSVVQQPQIVQEQEPQYDQQQPNVVVVQQPPQTVVQQGSSHDGFFTGMLMGHMMSGGSNHRTVINRTYTKKVYVNRPSQRRSYFGSSGRRSSFRRPSRPFRRR